MLINFPGYLSYKWELIQTLLYIISLFTANQRDSPNSFHLIIYFSSLFNKEMGQTFFIHHNPSLNNGNNSSLFLPLQFGLLSNCK